MVIICMTSTVVIIKYNFKLMHIVACPLAGQGFPLRGVSIVHASQIAGWGFHLTSKGLTFSNNQDSSLWMTRVLFSYPSIANLRIQRTN